MALTKLNNRSLSGSLITGQVPAIGGSDLPTKTVIQTKTSTLTGQVGTSSDSAVATGLTLAFTPVSAGSTFILNMASGQQTWDVTNLNMVAALYISNPTGVTPVFVSWIGAIRQTSTYNGKTRLGFIAQELEDAMPNNENDILDLVYNVNPERIEAKYSNLIPILTKAIQELHEKIKILTKK